MGSPTVAERLKEPGIKLTRSERLVADILFENYPASALGSITALSPFPWKMNVKTKGGQQTKNFFC